MGTKRRRGKWWLLAFTVLCLPPIAAVRFWPREPSLMERAVRVADTHGWELTRGTYNWVTNEAVLHNDSDAQHEFAVCLENVRFHTKNDLPRLNELTHGLIYFHASYTLSPDHKWVLWVSDRPNEAVACTLDGAKHARWSFQRRGSGSTWGEWFWLPDNRHWIELVQREDNGKVKAERIYDVRDPGKVTTLPLHLSKPQVNELDYTENGQMLGLVESDKNQSRSTLTIHEADVRYLSHPPHIYHVSLPMSSSDKKVVEEFSPNRKQLAIFIKSPPKPFPSWHKFIRHFWRLLPEDSPTVFRLWTCDLDGTGQHEIGKILRYNTKDDWDGVPHDMRWLPDGKRLSFVYRDTLYTVPAE